VALLNSPKYRQGPEMFNALETMKKETVAIIKNGSFTYVGLKPELLGNSQNSQGEESCILCHEGPEFCGLVMTRNQSKKVDKENLNAKYKLQELSKIKTNLPK
jgi:hypothetical protein